MVTCYILYRCALLGVPGILQGEKELPEIATAAAAVAVVMCGTHMCKRARREENLTARIY